MLRFGIAAVLILFASMVEAKPRGAATPLPQITCDITTGVATGATGPCASPLAVCDGVNADDTAFVSFRTWAVANQGTNQVVLTIPSGKTCRTSTFAAQMPFRGIKNFILSAYGASWILPVGNSGLSFGGQNLAGNNTSQANFAASSVGATCISLITPSEISRFTAGNYTMVSGGDLQGFGQPPNPFVFEFAKIQSLNASQDCSGAAGASMTFTAPLQYAYLTTWPNFFAGNGNEPYSGGPATVYVMQSSWDTEVEVRGLTLNNQAGGQSGAAGRKITYTDVTCLDTGCIIPSFTQTWTATNYQATNQTMEVDKIVTTMNLINSTVKRINIQSSSIKSVNITNSTITDFINGTGEINVFNGLTTANLEAGAYAYGATQSITCTNCSLGAISQRGVIESNVKAQYQMNSGVIAVPRQQAVIAAADNGSGLIRITIADASPWITGQSIPVFCNGSCGTTPITGTWVATIVNGTQIDLQGSTFSGSYTGNGIAGTGAVRWAVPGAQLFISGITATEAVLKATAVTGDAVNTYIATNLAGTWPAVPGSSLGIQVHPSPSFTCTNCTGSDQATSASLATPGAPLFSNWNASYRGQSFPSTDTVVQNLWGTPVSFSINVTRAYTGAQGTMQLLPSFRGLNGALADTFWAPTINLKTPGNRVITPSGVTCNGSAGGCSGDSGLAFASGYVNTSFARFRYNVNISGSGSGECTGATESSVCPIWTVDMTTNQNLPKRRQGPSQRRIQSRRRRTIPRSTRTGPQWQQPSFRGHRTKIQNGIG